MFAFKNSIQEPSSRYLRAVNRATQPKRQLVKRNKKHQRSNVDGRGRGLNGGKENMKGVEDDVSGDEEGMNGDEGGMNGDEGGMNGDEGGMNGDEGGMNGDEGGMNGDEGGMNGDEDGMNGDEGGMNGDEGSMNGDEDGMNGDEVDDINQQFWEQLEQKEIEIGELQIENEQLCIDFAELEDQNFSLKQEMSSLNAMLSETWQPSLHAVNTQHDQEPGFTAASLKGDDKKVTFYTGLPSYTAFQGVFKLFEPLLSKDESKSRLLLVDELLLVIMKLRLAVPNDDLGYRFNVTPTAVSTIFHKWIEVMSVELKCLIYWPDPVTLKENLPDCFRKHYSKVKCIIEIFIERPLNFEARAVTYSNYKKHNTVKCLIAITPTGSICFISNAWGGRVSDKEITQKCGFLSHIDVGDIVMADRGFNISDDLAQCSARLLIPAFTRGKSQLSKEEVEITRQLARVRIHVERVIGQMRKKYKILQNTLPINLIKCPSDNKKIDCTIDRILIVTAALTNLCLSVIPS